MQIADVEIQMQARVQVIVSLAVRPERVAQRAHSIQCAVGAKLVNALGNRTRTDRARRLPVFWARFEPPMGSSNVRPTAATVLVESLRKKVYLARAKAPKMRRHENRRRPPVASM